MRRLLQHPWLRLGARIILGLVFISAALPKIADPPGFAKAIWAYELFPAWSLNPLALCLPWLELFCGLALLMGWWRRAAGLWVAGLLLCFVMALSINVSRRHPVDCGCFGGSAPKTEAERLADMRWTIARDLGLLLLAAHLLWATKARSGASTPADGQQVGGPIQP